MLLQRLKISLLNNSLKQKKKCVKAVYLGDKNYKQQEKKTTRTFIIIKVTNI